MPPKCHAWIEHLTFNTPSGVSFLPKKHMVDVEWLDSLKQVVCAVNVQEKKNPDDSSSVEGTVSSICSWRKKKISALEKKLSSSEQKFQHSKES